MTEFGRQLRKFRQQCNDPKSPHGKLTQEKFGELLGEELGISYSGAAVSDWERGVSKIHADQRQVLISILKVLVQRGGIRTVLDANQLLEAGNYRALSPDETKRLFPKDIFDTESEPPLPSFERMESNSKSNAVGDFLFGFSRALEDIVAREKEGPSPYWPRLLVTIIRKFSDRFSPGNILNLFPWVWIWLLTWLLIAPSLCWPFLSQNEALSAVAIYAGGAIIIPALIGALTNTENNEFWQKQSINKLNLRLYTHQGASIGFHIGYFFIFMIGLLRYNLGLQSLILLEFIALSFPIVLAYASARLIPYNLLLAYKNLNLRNGGIFFTFFLISPAWGYFFLNTYEVLLTKALGIFTVFVALTILLVMMTVRQRQNGTTVIHVSWWVILFGSVMLCQLLALLIR